MFCKICMGQPTKRTDIPDNVTKLLPLWDCFVVVGLWVVQESQSGLTITYQLVSVLHHTSMLAMLTPQMARHGWSTSRKNKESLLCTHQIDIVSVEVLDYSLLKPMAMTWEFLWHLWREAFKKKKIKSVDFFHTGWGGQPQIHNFLKVWIFKGGWGVLGAISTLFCPILFFKKNFVLFYPVFVGWKVIFRVKLKKNFFPPKCVSTL